jgi:putative SOS response-associated peptidase YedK
MPVILTEPEDMETWLDPNSESEQLKHLLRPYPAKEMEAWKVDKAMYKTDGTDSAVTAKVK